MRLTFIHPAALWLLLLVPLVWALALLGPRRLQASQFWASLALRTMILLGLVLALAGTQLVQAIGATSTVFVLDGSDSVALSQRARAEAFIQQALAAMPADDQAGVVVFGREALVERVLSGETTFGQVSARPASGATNIEAALQLGLALLPNEGYRRVVLLSDGGETLGDALLPARIAAERGIPVDVVPLSGLADGLDGQIMSVRVPAAAREGQALRMQITLASNTATSGRLLVEAAGQMIANQVVQLPAGELDLELVLPKPQEVFNRYRVRLEIPGDARTENNVAEAYSFITGRPRVLLVEGEPGVAENLARALQASAIAVEVVAPNALPASLGELSAYEVVALVDVPKQAVPAQTQSVLAAYVHDLGRGLLMVGGPHAFGAGGWRETPVEQVLPVDMDIPSERNLPAASIVVLIDTSGSMADEEGGRTKLQLAADGAAQIATLMRDDDELTVIPFDSTTGRVVGPIPGSRRDEALRALQQVEPGGGGINIHDGLLVAERFINQSTKPVRHIITITDGNDTVQQEGALAIVQRLRDQRVTLTSIAVGDGNDVPFLRDAVRDGGGRFFLTQRASEVPAILTEEAQAVIRPYVVEEPFTPVQATIHPTLRDIANVPELGGHVVTTPKQTAQVLLATPRGEPVLAAWQYGLGRSLAWTSDFRGQWGGDWVAWTEFPRFAAGLVGWLLPSSGNQTLTIEPQTVNGQLVLEARTENQTGLRAGLRVSGQLLRGDGTSVAVSLREVGPGTYRAAVVDAPPGAYLVQLVAEDEQGAAVAAVTAGAVVPQSSEYRTRNGNTGLLAALTRLTGGRETIEPQQAFDPNLANRGSVSEIGLPLLLLALLLLPLDVAVRRLFAVRMRSMPSIGKQQVDVPQTTPAPAPATRHTTANKRAVELEQLRAAQERARKRARGEEP